MSDQKSKIEVASYKGKWLHPVVKVFLVLVLLGTLVFGALLGLVLGGAHDSIDGSPRVMIILGCQLHDWGPSVMLQDRLDKALEYLLAQLEEAGKLENTVICLSADHYPYGMTEAEYEELAGKSLSQGMDTFRNSLVLWNSSMAQEEPVHVEKVCGAMDLLPTLLNLFGFDYDARMYAGRDIFSDQEGMVIFNDRSYVTDMAEYKRGSDVIWKKDQDGNDLVPDEQKEDYLQEKKQEVKNRYQFSAYVLQENYYQDIEQAVILPAEE